MAIISAPPDYVSQVRGIIGDLRDNFIKKKQLFLQEKDQSDRLDLSYAQLGLQARKDFSQNRIQEAQLDLQRSQIENQSAAEQSRYSTEMAKINAAAEKKEQDKSLDERKFELELFKENKKLEEERLERERETNSGRLLQEGTVALNSDDPTKLIEWTNKLAGSILSQKQRNDVFTNALSLVDAKKRLEQDGVNIRSQPKALEIVQQVNMLDAENLIPDELGSKMEKYTTEFKNLGNTDPKINDLFMSVSQEVAKRQHEFKQKEYGQALNSFLRAGDLDQLEPAIQAEYDKIQSDYPAGQARVAGDYSTKIRRLLFKNNFSKSTEALKLLAQDANKKEQDILLQNPALAAITTDPATGVSVKTFPFKAPVLSPNIGFNGTIDPDTGLVNKSTLKTYEKWMSEVISPSLLIGQVPYMRGLNLTTPPAADKTTTDLPFNPSNAWVNAPKIQEPGTVRVVVTPAAGETKISSSTISTIIEAYQKNPDAVIYGRPAREILANLRAKGYAIPDSVFAPAETR